MGTLIGHVAPGLGFFLIGLWHLINNIKLHALSPKSYATSPWFPSPRFRYLELYSIMLGSLASISMELFVGPHRHQPLDPDGTIPSNHLHNFEHSNISLSFFAYALFSVVLDRLKPPAHEGLAYLLAAVAFGQQLLIFHLHSADHMGVEGQYHWLLQIAIFVSLVTTLLSIKHRRSFLNAFVRSVSVLFQGVWFVFMGLVLWTPSLVPKGCFVNSEEGHGVVRCRSEEALERAKALVNIEFSWFVVGVTVFAVVLYLVMMKRYRRRGDGDVADYESLRKFVLGEEDGDGDGDVESQKKAVADDHRRTGESFLKIGKQYGATDIER